LLNSLGHFYLTAYDCAVIHDSWELDGGKSNAGRLCSCQLHLMVFGGRCGVAAKLSFDTTVYLRYATQHSQQHITLWLKRVLSKSMEPLNLTFTLHSFKILFLFDEIKHAKKNNTYFFFHFGFMQCF
jgi:hypothetical protein